MTPDLSAAFLRCRDFLTSPGFVDVENASPECVADLLLIAREWAKTAREDDGILIDGDWLRSIYWLTLESPLPLTKSTHICPDPHSQLKWGSDGVFVSMDRFPEVKTRGHLRSLCRHLGIPLKELP